jgi:hypothetical protein
MKVIREGNENEMVHQFLTNELPSERFGTYVGKGLKFLHVAESVITNGNTRSEWENLLRREILGYCRGYNRKKFLFINYPPNIDWRWVELEKADFGKVRYGNYRAWTKMSNGTGKPLVAAQTIVDGGLEPVEGLTKDRFEDALGRLRGGAAFPPMIMFTDSDEEIFTVFEGCFRMTVYALAPELFSNVPVLLGFCDKNDLRTWFNSNTELTGRKME